MWVSRGNAPDSTLFAFIKTFIIVWGRLCSYEGTYFQWFSWDSSVAFSFRCYRGVILVLDLCSFLINCLDLHIFKYVYTCETAFFLLLQCCLFLPPLITYFTFWFFFPPSSLFSAASLSSFLALFSQFSSGNTCKYKKSLAQLII